MTSLLFSIEKTALCPRGQYGRAHVAFYGQGGEKALDFDFPPLTRMSLIVEEEEAGDPVHVCLLRAITVVSEAQDLADLVASRWCSLATGIGTGIGHGYRIVAGDEQGDPAAGFAEQFDHQGIAGGQHDEGFEQRDIRIEVALREDRLPVDEHGRAADRAMVDRQIKRQKAKIKNVKKGLRIQDKD